MSEAMKIGEVARKSGVAVQTVRYYEREGLLEAPPRSDGGYRLFPPETLDRLRFVARARRLGFSLAETRELLLLEVKKGATCAAVERRAREKLLDLETRIAELEAMRDALDGLLEQCVGTRPTSACPILNSLGTDTKTRTPKKRNRR